MFKVSSTPCHDFRLQMWLLRSGELPETEKKFWQQHLQSCPHCQATWASAESVQAQYQRLPLYEAPARIVHQITPPAPAPRAAKGWNVFEPWRTLFGGRQPRLLFAGVAFTVLLLSFHYLAFQKSAQVAWEATAFDEKVTALSITLQQYVSDETEARRRDVGDHVMEFSWDAQAAGLRESIAALTSELQNTKL